MTIFGTPELTKKEIKERAEEPGQAPNKAHLGVPWRQTLAHPRAAIHMSQLEKKSMKKAPAERKPGG